MPKYVCVNKPVVVEDAVLDVEVSPEFGYAYLTSSS